MERVEGSQIWVARARLHLGIRCIKPAHELDKLVPAGNALIHVARDVVRILS